jgi:hypothetical protein
VPAGSGASATVLQSTYLGSVTHVEADAGGAVVVAACSEAPPAPGDTIGLEPSAPPMVFPSSSAPDDGEAHER